MNDRSLLPGKSRKEVAAACGLTVAAVAAIEAKFRARLALKLLEDEATPKALKRRLLHTLTPRTRRP